MARRMFSIEAVLRMIYHKSHAIYLFDKAEFNRLLCHMARIRSKEEFPKGNFGSLIKACAYRLEKQFPYLANDPPPSTRCQHEINEWVLNLKCSDLYLSVEQLPEADILLVTAGCKE